MKVKRNSHVYNYLPDYKLVEDGITISNRRLPVAEQIVVKLSVISIDEDDANQRAMFLAMKKFSPDKAQELSEKRLNELLEKKFHGCAGLEVDGVTEETLQTWEGFKSEAPREIVQDAMVALRSTEQLSEGDQKNFVPESDGV
jgi:hypothetical protein